MLRLFQLFLPHGHTSVTKFFFCFVGEGHPTGAYGAAKYRRHGPLKTRRLFRGAQLSFNFWFGDWVGVERPFRRSRIVIDQDPCRRRRGADSAAMATLFLSDPLKCKQQSGGEQEEIRSSGMHGELSDRKILAPGAPMMPAETNHQLWISKA